MPNGNMQEMLQKARFLTDIYQSILFYEVSDPFLRMDWNFVKTNR